MRVAPTGRTAFRVVGATRSVAPVVAGELARTWHTDVTRCPAGFASADAEAPATPGIRLRANRHVLRHDLLAWPIATAGAGRARCDSSELPWPNCRARDRQPERPLRRHHNGSRNCHARPCPPRSRARGSAANAWDCRWLTQDNECPRDQPGSPYNRNSRMATRLLRACDPRRRRSRSRARVHLHKPGQVDNAASTAREERSIACRG